MIASPRSMRSNPRTELTGDLGASQIDGRRLAAGEHPLRVVDYQHVLKQGLQGRSPAHQELLGFLKPISRAYPGDGLGHELHLVMHNYAAHKRVEVRD